MTDAKPLTPPDEYAALEEYHDRGREIVLLRERNAELEKDRDYWKECQGILTRVEIELLAERDTLRTENEIMRGFLEQLRPDDRHSDVAAFLEGRE